MPNWCFNSLQATGPLIDITALLRDVCGLEPVTLGRRNEYKFNIDLAHAYPVPEDMHSTERRNWQLLHWGCRGSTGAAKVIMEFQGVPPAVTIYFATPWSPPTPWVQHLAAKHTRVRLTLAYNEELCLGRGLYEVQGGDVLQDIHRPCPLESRE